MIELSAYRSEVDPIVNEAEKAIEAITGKKVIVRVEVVVELKGAQRERMLKEVICEVGHVEWSDLVGPSREEELCEARHLFCWFAYNWLEYSYKAVGRLLGGRDHSTAVHSCNVVKDRLDGNDESMTQKFSEIQRLISKRLL